jgi:hypothetical protein
MAHSSWDTLYDLCYKVFETVHIRYVIFAETSGLVDYCNEWLMVPGLEDTLKLFDFGNATASWQPGCCQ